MAYASFLAVLVPAIIILAAIVFSSILRLGSGIAAVTGLGYLPASVLRPRLRRFLFGEQNNPRSSKK